MIKGDPVSRDPLKRLTVARRDDLQQHAALGVDLQHVALGLAAELVQLKHARGTALIRQPRDRSRGDRLAAGQTSESGGRESQRPKQRRGIKHQRDLLAVAVAQRQVTLIAVRAVALVPRPPGVAITDHVGTVAQAALVLYAERSSARQIRSTRSSPTGRSESSATRSCCTGRPASSALNARHPADERSSGRQMR